MIIYNNKSCQKKTINMFHYLKNWKKNWSYWPNKMNSRHQSNSPSLKHTFFLCRPLKISKRRFFLHNKRNKKRLFLRSCIGKEKRWNFGAEINDWSSSFYCPRNMVENFRYFSLEKNCRHSAHKVAEGKACLELSDRGEGDEFG